jgi:hypothetical protein
MQSSISGSGPENQTTSGRERTLAELEQIVTVNLPTESKFVTAGTALKQIRDGKLNAPESWEPYLRRKWNISRQYAHCLIQAADFASTVVDKPPTERAARKMISDARRAKKPKQPKQPVKVKAESTVSGPVNRTTLAQIMANSPDPEEQTVEEEFEKFKAYLWDWEMDLSKDDYLRLVTKIYEHTDEIRIKAGWTDDVLIARENARLDAQEAAKAAAEIAVAV